jgi:hypothetical protein
MSDLGIVFAQDRGAELSCATQAGFLCASCEFVIRS